jgi:hypothetical protein
MKTLISSTEASATYEFAFGNIIRVVEYSAPDQNEGSQNQEQLFNHEAISEAEYQGWMAWLGESV